MYNHNGIMSSPFGTLLTSAAWSASNLTRKSLGRFSQMWGHTERPHRHHPQQSFNKFALDVLNVTAS